MSKHLWGDIMVWHREKINYDDLLAGHHSGNFILIDCDLYNYPYSNFSEWPFTNTLLINVDAYMPGYYTTVRRLKNKFLNFIYD